MNLLTHLLVISCCIVATVAYSANVFTSKNGGGDDDGPEDADEYYDLQVNDDDAFNDGVMKRQANNACP